MRTVTRPLIVALSLMMVLPGLTHAEPIGAGSRSGALKDSPLTAGCTTSLTASPLGSVDVNQTVSFTATLSSGCTSGTGNYAYIWHDLPANCTAPSTYPTTTTSSSETFNCHPRYYGNVSNAQTATYYDYVYNISVSAMACSKVGCGAPGDPVYTTGAYLPFAIYGEPRLLAGGTGSTSVAAEVGVTKTLSTYFPLGAVGVDQTLSRNWLLMNALVGGNPSILAYDNSTDQVFISNGASGYNVSAYSINEGIVTTAISTGNGPAGIAVADGKVFIANRDSNNVSIINPRTDKVTGSISPVALPNGMAYDAINGYLYIADGSPGSCLDGTSNVTVVNATSNTIVGAIHIPGFAPRNVGYDPSTHEVYVTNDYSCSPGTYGHNVSAIYTAPGNIGVVVSILTVGTMPSAVGYSSVSHDIYVTNEVSNTVTIISDSTNTVVKTIGVGTYPTGITTWSHDEGHLFMSNIGSANITIINTTTNSVQFSFGEQGLNYAADILDYGDLVISNILTGNLTTIFFQNSTVPEYGSGLYAPPSATQGSIVWSSSNGTEVPISSCSSVSPDRFCTIDPAHSGNVTVNAYPSDTNGGDAYFGAVNVTLQIRVYPQLQAGPLISNRSTQGQIVADAGSPVTLKVAVVNGTGPGTYTSKWTGLPSGCVTSNSTQISCAPKVTGRYNVTASIKDALGGSLVRTNVLKVYPPPRLAILSASNTTAYTNSTLFVDPVVHGGAPPYLFCVATPQSSSCSPETISNSTDLSYTLTQAGNFSVTVSVSDAAGVVRNYSFNEEVAYLPQLVNLVGPSQADAGQNVTFTAQVPAGHGLPPLNVTWVDASTGRQLCAPQVWFTSNVTSRCTFSPTDSVQVAVTVTDSAGSSWNSYTPLTVHPDPTVSLPTLEGLQGKSIPVQVRLSGGEAPYEVCVTSAVMKCLKVSTTSTFFNLTYAAAGSYFVTATLNDSLGQNVSVTTTVSVYMPMTLTPVHALWDPIDAATPDTFNITASGGSPVFSTWWNETGSGILCSGTSMATCTAPLMGSGVATVYLTVQDLIGDYLVENLAVTVDSRLSLQLPAEKFTAGREGWLNGTVSGGTSPYSWVLTGGPGPTGTGTTTNVSILTMFPSPGNYSLYFQATDGGGGLVSGAWSISVVPSTTTSLMVPCAPSGPTTLRPLENGTYNVSCVSGGSAPYSFAWIWADSTVTQGGSSASHNYRAPGYYNITVMVRDASGGVAFAQSLEVTVSGSSIQNPPSLPCSPTGSTNLSVGVAGDYSISCVTGGVAPYRYTWEFQDGTTVVGDSAITHQFNKSGAFEVTVLVTDALGRVASSSPLRVTVTATTHATSGTAWTTLTISSLFYPLLLAVALAAAAVAYVAVRKYRRRNKSQGNATNDETKGNTHDDERTNERKED